MSRRTTTKKKLAVPDPVYNSRLVSMLTVRILKEGKKHLAQRIIYQTLNQMRANIKMTKTNRANAGETNQFIGDHKKDDTNVRPSQTHKKASERHATSIPKITEEINKIKMLIKY